MIANINRGLNKCIKCIITLHPYKDWNYYPHLTEKNTQAQKVYVNGLSKWWRI